jgi:signal transduction histidine kinase
MRSTFGRRTLIVTMKMLETRGRLAEVLHDQFAQHLAGTVLAAGALSVQLNRRNAPEAREAKHLLEMLMDANKELNYLIARLDAGKPR